VLGCVRGEVCDGALTHSGVAWGRGNAFVEKQGENAVRRTEESHLSGSPPLRVLGVAQASYN
jgi:hypothetical protein